MLGVHSHLGTVGAPRCLVAVVAGDGRHGIHIRGDIKEKGVDFVCLPSPLSTCPLEMRPTVKIQDLWCDRPFGLAIVPRCFYACHEPHTTRQLD